MQGCLSRIPGGVSGLLRISSHEIRNCRILVLRADIRVEWARFGEALLYNAWKEDS